MGSAGADRVVPRGLGGDSLPQAPWIHDGGVTLCPRVWELVTAVMQTSEGTGERPACRDEAPFPLCDVLSLPLATFTARLGHGDEGFWSSQGCRMASESPPSG